MKHGSRFKDLKDQVFGSLKVLKFHRSEGGRVFWLCECMACGLKKPIRADALYSQGQEDCGCLKYPTRTKLSEIPPPEKGCLHIPLTGGRWAKIDEDDGLLVMQYRWRFDGVYAVATSLGQRLEMHNLISGRQSGMEVDHRSRDALDNRRSNLRHCTESQNKCNRRKPKNNTSGYKGVYWDKGINKWCSSIMLNKKKKFLGTFTDPKLAHDAYASAARQLHGEFACLI